MNPEQGIFLPGIQFVVEVAIILISEIRRLAHPHRLSGVDHLVAVCIHHLTIFPLLLLATYHGHRKEAAILLQQRIDLALLQEFLVLIVDVEYYICTTVAFVDSLHGVLRRTVALPTHTLRTVLVRQRTDLDFPRHHECRIEAESEVTDYGVRAILVLFEKLLRTRECDLIYLSISSAVIPMPRSETVRVPFSASTVTRTSSSPSSSLYSPNEASVRSFWVASTALLTSSRRKIS